MENQNTDTRSARARRSAPKREHILITTFANDGAVVLVYPENGRGRLQALDPDPELLALRIGREAQIRLRARWGRHGWMVLGRAW